MMRAFGELPRDLLIIIFNRLSSPDFLNASQVNQHWRGVSQNCNRDFEKAFQKRFPEIYPVIKRRGLRNRDWRQWHWIDKFARYEPMTFLEEKWGLGSQENWEAVFNSGLSNLYEGENQVLFRALAEDDFEGFSDAVHEIGKAEKSYLQNLIIRELANEQGYFLLFSKGEMAKQYAQELWASLQGGLANDVNLLLMLAIITLQPITTIKALIESGAGVNHRFFVYGDEESTLHLACGQGDLELVQVLVKNGVRVNSGNKREMSASEQASELGHDKIVKYLGDTNSAFAWIRACRHGYLELAQRLFTGSLARHLVDEGLFYAIIHGHKELADFIIRERLKDDDEETLAHVLYVICWAGALDLLEKLLQEKKPDLDVIVNDVPESSVPEPLVPEGTGFYLTALVVACAEGHLEVVKFLFEKGANIKKEEEEGSSLPLFWAASNGHSEVAKFLQEKHAFLSAVDLEDLLLETCARGPVSLAQILLNQDPSLIHKEDQTHSHFIYFLFAMACDSGKTPMARFLLEKMSPEQKAGLSSWRLTFSEGLAEFFGRKIGFTGLRRLKYYQKPKQKCCALGVFHLAVISDRCETVAFLISLGFIVDQKTHLNGLEDETALHLAASTEMLELLLSHKANPNISNEDGLTPFHCAMLGNFEFKKAKFLLERGSEPNFFNKEPKNMMFCSSNYNKSEKELEDMISFYENIIEKIPKTFSEDEIPQWKKFGFILSGHLFQIQNKIYSDHREGRAFSHEKLNLFLLLVILTGQLPEEVMFIAELGASLVETEKYKINPIALADIFDPSVATGLRNLQAQREIGDLSRNESGLFYPNLPRDSFEENPGNGGGHESQAKRPRSP